VQLIPAQGAGSLWVSVDGAARVALPSAVRLASGRHRFAVTKGKATEQRSELVVCGRVTRLVFSQPR
jgi:hypothetical protein